MDITELAPVDEEEYVGEGVEVARAGDAESALEAAAGQGATPERWVNQGMVQDEHADARG